MSRAQNVVSIDFARRQREALPPPVPGQEDLERRIALVCPRYVSPGATLLLLHIAIYLYQEDGDLSTPFLCEGLGCTPKTIRKYTEELEDNHLLKVRRSRISKKQNEVNQFEIDFNGPLGNQMSALKIPKRQRIQGRVKITPPPSGVGEKFPGNKDTYKEDIRFSKENQRIAGRSAQRFDSVDEAISATTARTTASREAAVRKAARRPALMLAGVKAMWATVLLRHYPTVPPVVMSGKDFAIFKARMQPLVATASLESVFTYFIENWSTLREIKFKWLRAAGKDVAAAPSIPELMRYWKTFAQAYADHRMGEATATTKSSVSREQELEKALRESIAQNARTEAEKARLQTRLATTERIAYAPRKPATVRDTRTLTERRRAVDDRYTSGNDDIPDWK